MLDIDNLCGSNFQQEQFTHSKREKIFCDMVAKLKKMVQSLWFRTIPNCHYEDASQSTNGKITFQKSVLCTLIGFPKNLFRGHSIKNNSWKHIYRVEKYLLLSEKD